MKEKSNTFAGCRYAVVLITLVFAFTAAYGQSVVPNPGNGNYQIGPGDVIDVTVSNNAVLSKTGVRVTYLGTVQLPMMDTDMQAACLTERELADQIKEVYRKYMVDPFVNVAVKEFNSNPVAVIGAVNAPGRFQLQRSIHLAELLTYVNGTSDKAGRTVDILRDSKRPRCDGTKLIVPEGGEDELISVNLSELFGGGADSNPAILPGDIIRVSDNSQLTAYIQGNVASSIAINLMEPVTLTQAIAMAGGPSSGAQLDKVKIRRQVSGSVNREEMVANVKDIINGKRDDILLEPNDIVDIPGPSGAKKFFGDFFRTLVPTVLQVPTRVIPIR